MIRHLRHHEIDKQKWDSCIAGSVNGLIYAYAWYLDIASPGWEALTNSDYTTVFPLTLKKKYGITYLYPPYFIQQAGVFSVNDISQNDVQNFLNAIPPAIRFVEYNLNWKNNFPVANFGLKKNLTHHLNLTHDYNHISKCYSQNIKRNLKKAFHLKLRLIDVEPSGIITMFRKNRGSTISNLKPANYKALLELIGQAGNRGLLHIAGAEWENKLCAGSVFFKSDSTLIFIFSAADARGKQCGAMTFLIDNVIRLYAGTDNILDFEGSNNSSLARFYKGFGAAPVNYFQIRRNDLPEPFRWLKNLKAGF